MLGGWGEVTKGGGVSRTPNPLTDELMATEHTTGLLLFTDCEMKRVRPPSAAAAAVIVVLLHLQPRGQISFQGSTVHQGG